MIKQLFVQFVTFIRIACAVAIIIAALHSQWASALVFTLIAFVSDFVDGWLARRWQVVSAFGMFFDPFADKVVCLTVLWLAALHYSQPIYIVLASIITSYDAITTALRLSVARKRTMPASRIAKIKTAVLMVGLIIVLIGIIGGQAWWSRWVAYGGIAMLSTATILSVYSLIRYIQALAPPTASSPRHQSSSLPDWTYIDPTKRNLWQRIGATTYGVITPGNIITLVGLTLVCVGAFDIVLHKFLLGFSYVGIGRLCDIADGIIANKTNTKSPLGEMIDATADKLAILALLVALSISSATAWEALGLVAIQNFVNVGLSYKAKRNGVTLHPSIAGKLATTWQWLGIVGVILANLIPLAIWPAYLFIIIGLVMGTQASWGYFKAVSSPR